MMAPGWSTMLLTSNRGGPSGQTTAQQAAGGAQRRRAPVHHEASARFQQRQRGDQTADAEQMIEMGVGEQHAVQSTEPDPAREQLALRALAAVNQEPARPVQDEQRWQPPVDRGHAGRGAKEDDLEQAALVHPTLWACIS
jgi:hypothetical protein